jgi:hypothetical protein
MESNNPDYIVPIIFGFLLSVVMAIVLIDLNDDMTIVKAQNVELKQQVDSLAYELSSTKASTCETFILVVDSMEKSDKAILDRLNK